MMDLSFKKIGNYGSPVIILHGLYGSSDNWLPLARVLGQNHQVFLLDQRNHGDSPHSERHNYYLLRDDLKEFIDNHRLEKVTLIGHSMGGKTAVYFALKYPENLSNLIVVDISPKPYAASDLSQSNLLNHFNIVQAMLNVDFSKAAGIREVEEQLKHGVPEKRIRQFLLKNLRRTEGKIEWKLNVPVISRELPAIMDGIKPIEIVNYQGITAFPVLFIKGSNSTYILEEDKKMIRKLFPYAEFSEIADAGHWLHAEQFNAFKETVTGFLNL